MSSMHARFIAAVSKMTVVAVVGEDIGGGP
jgi:hypothetical protein